jgi:hypothetical protein
MRAAFSFVYVLILFSCLLCTMRHIAPLSNRWAANAGVMNACAARLTASPVCLGREGVSWILVQSSGAREYVTNHKARTMFRIAF